MIVISLLIVVISLLVARFNVDMSALACIMKARKGVIYRNQCKASAHAFCLHEGFRTIFVL